jgi:hypothetical protein
MACALVVRDVAGGSLLTGRPLPGRRCCICLPCRRLVPATAQPADIGGGCVRRGPAREGAGPLRRTDHPPSRREGASTSGHCASRHRRPGTVPDHPPNKLDRQRYWAEFPYFTEANLNTVVSNWVVCCGRSSSPLVVGIGPLAVAAALGWRSTAGVLRLWALLLIRITLAVVSAGDWIRMLAYSAVIVPIAAQRAWSRAGAVLTLGATPVSAIGVQKCRRTGSRFPQAPPSLRCTRSSRRAGHSQRRRSRESDRAER